MRVHISSLPAPTGWKEHLGQHYPPAYYTLQVKLLCWQVKRSWGRRCLSLEFAETERSVVVQWELDVRKSQKKTSSTTTAKYMSKNEPRNESCFDCLIWNELPGPPDMHTASVTLYCLSALTSHFIKTLLQPVGGGKDVIFSSPF